SQLDDSLPLLKIRGADLHTYLRPSECELRSYLRYHHHAEADPRNFDETLIELAKQHEATYLKTFVHVKDLSQLPWNERFKATVDAISQGEPVIYQPLLIVQATLDGLRCEISGEPDFLILDSNGYAIRDTKIARSITRDAHPEIILQSQLYGWLF